MPEITGGIRPARTVLEQLIRDRQLTLEEFVTYAADFARDTTNLARSVYDICKG